MIPVLSSSEKSRLRGRGQTLDATLKIGKEGTSPTVLTTLHTLLRAHDLVKVRFASADREARVQLTAALAEGSESVCVGSVGSTALFYRPKSAE